MTNLSRRRKAAPQPYPEHWQVSTEAVIHGRHVVRGQPLSIRGERGVFRFDKHVVNTRDNVEWITCIGGPAGAESWRDFRPERVKRVHRMERS